MTTERVAKLVRNLRGRVCGMSESREQITAWLETFAPSLSVEERNELIELLIEETKAMIDFGQKFAVAYMQWSQKVGRVDTTKPREKRRGAIRRIGVQAGERRTIKWPS